MPKVKTVDEVPGLREWRFVPAGWESPIPHHIWCEVIEDRVTHWLWVLRLQVYKYPVIWFRPNGAPYAERIDYHSKHRPVLVLVGNIQ